MHRVLVLPILLAASSCSRSQPLPITGLDRVTRIEVRERGTESQHVIDEPLRVARVVAALQTLASGWEKPSFTPLPVGNASAVFYRDTSFVGVIWLGSNFVSARGQGDGLVRHTSPTELETLAIVLEIPMTVIASPPRAH